jgi:hypothetical protein
MPRAHLVENLRDKDLLRTLGDAAVLELASEAAAEIEILRATILRFVDLAESYPDSPNDIRPQVRTLGRNALNLPGDPS